MRADLIGLEVDPVAEEQHDTGLIERGSRSAYGITSPSPSCCLSASTLASRINRRASAGVTSSSPSHLAASAPKSDA